MKTSSIKLSIFAVLLCVFSITAAQIEKWVDDEGKVHYGNYSPTEFDSEPVTNAPLTTVFRPSKTEFAENPLQAQPDSAAGASQANSLKSQTSASQTPILFTTSWCGYCRKARAYMARNRIAYNEYDIETHAQARAEFRRYGDRGVPLLVVGDRHMRGFSQKRYNHFFKR